MTRYIVRKANYGSFRMYEVLDTTTNSQVAHYSTATDDRPYQRALEYARWMNGANTHHITVETANILHDAVERATA